MLGKQKNSMIGIALMATSLSACENPNPKAKTVPNPSPAPILVVDSIPDPEPSQTPSASPLPEPSLSPSVNPSSPSPSPSAEPSPEPSPIPSPSPSPVAELLGSLHCTAHALGNVLDYVVAEYSDGSSAVSCSVLPTAPHVQVSVSQPYADDSTHELCDITYYSGSNHTTSYQHYVFTVTDSVPDLVLTVPSGQNHLTLSCVQQ